MTWLYAIKVNVTLTFDLNVNRGHALVITSIPSLYVCKSFLKLYHLRPFISGTLICSKQIHVFVMRIHCLTSTYQYLLYNIANIYTTITTRVYSPRFCIVILFAMFSYWCAEETISTVWMTRSTRGIPLVYKNKNNKLKVGILILT